MSTQLLGNVQLITVQEVEAMLDEVVVPEARIDAKVQAEADARQAADALLQGAIDTEATTRQAADEQLQDNIDAEATTRETADQTLQTNINNEAETREQADIALSNRAAALETGLEEETTNREAGDQAIREELATTEVEELSNVHCSRFTNLPIATIQVDNDDKSISVGDTIATVSGRYLPKIPVDFVMSSEQIIAQVSKTYLLMLRLDTTGNINVINMVELADGSSATDTAAVTYITAA